MNKNATITPRRSRFRAALTLLISLICLIALLLTGCGSSGDSQKGKNNDKTTKVTLSPDMVTVSGAFYYTGSPIVPEKTHYNIRINDRSVSPNSFSYVCEDNIEPGQAKVTVTANPDNPYATGSTVVYFTIEPDRTAQRVSTVEELKAILSEGHYSRIFLDAEFTVEENDEIVIPSNTSVDVYTFTTETGETRGGKLSNRGTITIKPNGRLSVGGSTSFSCVLINSGAITVENGGTISLNAGGKFFNGGRFVSDSAINSFGAVYTNSPITVANSDKGVYVERTLITDENVSLTSESVVFTDNVYNNTVGVTVGDVSIDWNSLSYENNDRPGKAKVTIDMSETDERFYGHVEKEFTVLKGKTKFSSEEELIAKKQTLNYDEYSYNGYGDLALHGDLTINEDETLKCDESFIVQAEKTLTNNGTIEINGRIYSTFSVQGTLINNGTITLTKSSLGGSGSIYNGTETENGVVRGRIVGRILTGTNSFFDNYGVCLSGNETDSLHFTGDVINRSGASMISLNTFYVDGDLLNDGEISSANSFISQKSVTNSGSMSLSTSINFKGDVLNNGQISLSGNVKVGGDVFANEGSIYVQGKIFFVSGIFFSTTENGFKCDNCEVWAYETLERVSEINIITALTDSLVTLDYEETEYDGSAQTPLFTVNGERVSEEELEEHFTIGYYYENDENPRLAREIKNAGSVRIRIAVKDSFDKIYYRFSGTVDKYYRITPTSLTLNDKYIFTSVMSNANYGSVTLATDITCTDEIVLSAGKTLDLNGYSLELKNSAKFTNRGLVIIGENGSSENKVGLKLTPGTYNSPRFENYGTLRNNGSVYINENNCVFRNGTNGTIENNGGIYTFEEISGTVTGTGRIYVRKKISSSDIALEYEKIDFSGEENKPTVTVKDGLNVLDNADFIINYANNVHAGEATVTVKVKNSVFNEYFFGETEVNFTVDRITAYIGTSDLSSDGCLDNLALQNYPSTDYARYELTTNIKIDQTVNLPDNAVFDIGEYDVTFITGGKFALGENTELYVTVDSVADFEKYQYGATKITLGADIGESLVYDSVSKKYNHDGQIVYDYEKNMVFCKDYFTNATAKDLTVDLNGHDFPGQFKIIHGGNQEVKLTIMNGSDDRSLIGTYDNQYLAIIQEWANGDSSARLNIVITGNIKIYGMKMDGLANGILTLNVNGCSFETKAEGTYGSNNNFYDICTLDIGNHPSFKQNKNRLITSFTDCRFKGGTAANLGCGKYTFTSCVFEGTAPYYAHSYDTRRGNAITLRQAIASHDGSTVLEFTATDCTLKSTDGYGLEFVLGTYTAQNMTYCTIKDLSPSTVYVVKDEAHKTK